MNFFKLLTILTITIFTINDGAILAMEESTIKITSEITKLNLQLNVLEERTKKIKNGLFNKTLITQAEYNIITSVNVIVSKIELEKRKLLALNACLLGTHKSHTRTYFFVEKDKKYGKKDI